jgi:chromosome segregation ATPase
MESGSTEQDQTAASAEVTALRGSEASSRAKLAEARSQLERLGACSVIELEKERAALTSAVDAQKQRLEEEREEAARALLHQGEEASQSLQADLDRARGEKAALETQLLELRKEVVTTEETALLQEAGVYEYHHPLSDSIAYQGALKALQAEAKSMNRRDGGAVYGATNWEVNGSLPKGRKMVRDFSKLMRRAYNSEADNLVRSLKPYKLPAAVDRLNKVVSTIARLGQTMDIRISSPYHELRIRELALTADFRQKQAGEKEREREEKERLREERAAQKEMEREKTRLEKERQHYLNTLETLRAKGDSEAVARHEAELAEIERAISDVDYRAANIRAGYVYVISNIGSFGEGVVRIGMTRRLEPKDRVRELGDASVPFRFDEHALLFSQDAVGIEHALHQRLADRRVNRVNTRRKSFYATPAEVKAHLLDVAGELLSFQDTAEALEYHQSQNLAESQADVGQAGADG